MLTGPKNQRKNIKISNFYNYTVVDYVFNTRVVISYPISLWDDKIAEDFKMEMKQALANSMDQIQNSMKQNLESFKLGDIHYTDPIDSGSPADLLVGIELALDKRRSYIY